MVLTTFALLLIVAAFSVLGATPAMGAELAGDRA